MVETGKKKLLQKNIIFDRLQTIDNSAGTFSPVSTVDTGEKKTRPFLGGYCFSTVDLNRYLVVKQFLYPRKKGAARAHLNPQKKGALGPIETRERRIRLGPPKTRGRRVQRGPTSNRGRRVRLGPA